MDYFQITLLGINIRLGFGDNKASDAFLRKVLFEPIGEEQHVAEHNGGQDQWNDHGVGFRLLGALE